MNLISRNVFLILLILASSLSNVILADYGRQQVNSYGIRRKPSRYQQAYRNFYSRNDAPARSPYGITPGSVCAVDSDCAGYPLSFCDGVCKCISGALDAGSTCIASGSALTSAGSCAPGQIYVSEAGACMSIQQPGEPCQYSQQCSGAEPGAHCVGMRCECVYGMRLSGSGTGCTFADINCTQRGYVWVAELGECKEVIPPGGKGCSHSLQCTEAYPDATCYLQNCTCPIGAPIAIDGTCGTECPAGQTYSGVTGQCLPSVQPGKQCLYTSQCHASFPGLVCDRNRCSCPNGRVFSGSRCTDACPQGYRVDSNGVCAPENRRRAIDHQYLRVESPALGRCDNGESCGGGSSCSNGLCQCPPGRSALNGQCVTPITVDIGSACVRVGVECGGGAICVSGTCVCPLGSVPYHNQCVKHRTANPGESCAQGEECAGNTACDTESLKCECVSPLQIVIGDRCVDRLRSHPGFPCSNGEICVGGSECVEGKCACTEGKVNINKICVHRRTARPGDPCDAGEACSGNSVCDRQSKKCTCLRGQQAYKDICMTFQMVFAGESCTSPTTRCGGQSYCVRGRCQCAEHTILVDKKCVRARQILPGARCGIPTDVCSGTSECRDGFCTCIAPTVRRGTRCELPRNVLPGENCREGDHCLNNSECRNGKCHCPVGLVQRGNGCHVRRRVRPTFLCTEEDLCVGFSVCISGICSCKSEQIVLNDTCTNIKRSFPGQECGAERICTGGSICEDSVCVCGPDQRVIGKECRNNVRVGPEMPCANGEICLGGSVCDRQSKTCKCTTGTFIRRGQCIKLVVEDQRQVSTNLASTEVPDEFTTTPSSVTSRRFRCYRDSDCNGKARCSNGLCTCPQGELYVRGRCQKMTSRNRKPALLGRRCDSDAQCAVANSICVNNICSCMSDYRIFGSTQCIRKQPVTPTPPLATTTEELTMTSIELWTTTVESTAEDTTTPMSVTEPTTVAPPVPYTPARPCSVRGRKDKDGNEIPACPSPKALPGWPCNSRTQCLKGSFCVHNVCQCPPGFTEIQGICRHQKIVDPGNSCSEGEQCRYGSECRHGMCICPDHLVLSPDNKCLPPLSELRKRRPDPRKDVLAECPKDGSCLLPDCFCTESGTIPPGGISPSEVPQMIILSFDDPVTDRTIGIYKSLFDGELRNPNGCRIKGTFFVSHQWNNYDQTQSLFAAGHEIGVNSITHESLNNASIDRWRHEMSGLRETLKEFSFVDGDKIKGIRAPQLLIGGDNQFKMMTDNNFAYDNSIPLSGGPFWPQTLDHKLAWDCAEQNCPTKPHKGIWELPIHQLQSSNQRMASMVRSAIKPFDSPDSVHQMLKRNFLKHYNRNRAPFVITADTDFLTILPNNGAVNGLEDFLREVLSMPGVYVVTGSQAIDWMRKPTRLTDIQNFAPWQCPFQLNDDVAPCETPTECSYPSANGAKPNCFRTCGTCPKSFPWIENPLGERIV